MSPLSRTSTIAVTNGLFVGGVFGVLQLLWAHRVLASLPLSSQYRYLAITWYSYALAGAIMTGTLLAATFWWKSRQIGQGKSLVWPPAIAVAGFVWLEIVATGSQRSPWGLLGAAFAAVVAFTVACWATKNVPQLRANTVWAGLNVLALFAAVVWVSLTEPASHGFAWTDALLLAPAFFIAGTGLVPTLPGSFRLLWRLSSGTLILVSFSVLLAIRGTAENPGSLEPEGDFNVLLITVDTLRADHVGSYGSLPVRTPHMDRLAGEGVLFENVISPSPLTNPSHTTILTGLYPGNHGVILNSPIPPGKDILTLPEIFRSRGYKTAAFVSARVLGRQLSTLHERFQLYEDELSPWPLVPEAVFQNGLTRLLRRGVGISAPLGSRPAGETISKAKDWLRLNRFSRFFLWMHFYDPHGNYEPPPPFDRMYDPDYSGSGSGKWYETSADERERLIQSPRELEHIKALYAGEVSYVDAQIGSLLGEMDDLGLTEQTLIVFTSDHGESLTEHDYFFDHSVCLYDPSLKVPLIFRFPNKSGAGKRVSSQAGLTDVFPSILDAMGLEAGADLDGRSLLMRSENSLPQSDSSTIISSIFKGEIRGHKALLSVRTSDHKYIRTSAWWADLRLMPPSEELYDLVQDPGETENIATLEPERMEFFRDLATAYWQEWDLETEKKERPTSDEDAEVLRSLGYIQ